MNRIRIFGALIIFSIAASCSAAASPQSPSADEAVESQVGMQQPVNVAASAAEKQAQQNNTAAPQPPANTATPQPTNTQTPLPACPPAVGYAWSEAFPGGISYIQSILPAADGSYIVAGALRENAGTWVAKIDPDGKLIWQKQFLPTAATLKAAANGNWVLEGRAQSLELDTEGNVVSSARSDLLQPNADGSYTWMGAGRIAHFNNPDQVQWAVDFVDFDAYGYPTSDGGAIYPYVGSYVDKSVYWAPFYTDIKVIKVDGNGQVWQRVYGVLTGIEYLEQVLPTDDGGAILAGTHSYDDSGSDFDIWLMKVNGTGSLSWQTTLRQAPNSEPITALFPLTNGLLLVSDDNYSTDTQLVYLGKNGALLWQKRLSSVRGWIDIQAVADAPDGGLLVAGETREANNVSFLARFNAKGGLLWEKLTGFYKIENSPDSYANSILPLPDGGILLGGGTLLEQGIPEEYGAWLAEIADAGEVQGFLTVSPGKFSATKTISGRPRTLPDVVFEPGGSAVSISAVENPVTAADFTAVPACLAANASYPTPQALPSLTPTITPTPGLVRDLYWTSPAMQGDDVLKLQQRLLELGYDEVGEPDGIFGKMTQNAVKAFQQNNHLEADGYVGWRTWDQLFREGAKRK